jgi:hypothetical protein
MNKHNAEFIEGFIFVFFVVISLHQKYVIYGSVLCNTLMNPRRQNVMDF